MPHIRSGRVSVLPSLSVIEETAEESLIDTIQSASSVSQFVIVDLEGVASQAATFAISQADLVIIPCGPSYLDAVEAAAVLKVVKACEQMARTPITIPAAVLLTKTSQAIKPDTLREIERQFDTARTPVYDVRLHTRTAYAAIFSRGVPLHDLDPPGNVHKLDAAIENAEAFMAGNHPQARPQRTPTRKGQSHDRAGTRQHLRGGRRSQPRPLQAKVGPGRQPADATGPARHR